MLTVSTITGLHSKAGEEGTEQTDAKACELPTLAEEFRAWARGGGPAAIPSAPERAEFGARVTHTFNSWPPVSEYLFFPEARSGKGRLPHPQTRDPLLQASAGAALLWTVPRPVSYGTHVGQPGTSNVTTASHFRGSGSCFGGHSTGGCQVSLAVISLKSHTSVAEPVTPRAWTPQVGVGVAVCWGPTRRPRHHCHARPHGDRQAGLGPPSAERVGPPGGPSLPF